LIENEQKAAALGYGIVTINKRLHALVAVILYTLIVNFKGKLDSVLKPL